MRFYGGKIIRQTINTQLSEKKEMRDAIVWDVYPESKYCRVKIQGSDTLIKAWFPVNYEYQPAYIKPGTAVRISHPGGNKSRIEVTGPGFLIPTAVAGGTATPTPQPPGDAILSGGNLSPTAEANDMTVIVAPGTYRIDQVVYSISQMQMDDPLFEMDREDLSMGSTGGIVILDSASSTKYRYDSVVIGVDGSPYAVKGDEFSSTDVSIPTPPIADAGTLRLGWVLLYPNMTAVTSADINKIFTVSIPSKIQCDVSDTDLDHTEMTSTITLSIRDQYGNVVSRSLGDYAYTISFARGTGEIEGEGQNGDQNTPITFNSYGYGDIITYTRQLNEEPGVRDTFPIFNITESVTGLVNIVTIYIRDESEELMI
jgi:hypothetical protein